jgi:glycosyltransferase involved in cell wall biosynthesis
MKTVAHVLHHDGAGGGPVTVTNQIRFFRQYFNLHVFHGGRGVLADYCEKNGVSHTQIPLERKLKIPLGILLLWWHLLRLKPDVLILHGQWAGPVGAIAGRLAGINSMLYIVRWPSFYTDWDLLRVLRNHIAERIPCRLANRIIVLSEGNKYQFLIRRLAPDEKFSVVNNSFNPADIPNAETSRMIREKHGWPDRECHVVSVGRLADQKRVDWLLKSWKIVVDQHYPARLWIIGGGPEEQTLRRMAQDLTLGDTCQFLGPRKGIDYIAAADVVVMTTLYESFGNIPLEAMACGKPIVASAVDGVGDTLRDGVEGFLIPPGDFIAFAKRLVELILDAKLRTTMGARGLERVKAFHPSIKVKQLVDLIEQLPIRHGCNKRKEKSSN